MFQLLRDAPAGQLIRWVTGNRVLRYPEEEPDFALPTNYELALSRAKKSQPQPSDSSTLVPPGEIINTSNSARDTPGDEELAKETAKFPLPVEIKDGLVLVDWYALEDAENPQAWSQTKKSAVAFIIFIYTFIVYTGSAIYTSSSEDVVRVFGVSITATSLGLSLYVLGYGIGPLIFSPLSELPSIGRSPIYCITMFLFVIVSIPLPMVNNLAGLLVLRFLQGFFGSPCLATGGATMQDLYSPLYLPFALSIWVTAAYCGPALGPLLSGFAVEKMGWRWSLWEILWGAAPVFVIMFVFLPETSAPTLLHKRAIRLRKLLGTQSLMSQSEISQGELEPLALATEAIIKPLEISIKDPAVLFVQLYTAIVYSIYYSVSQVKSNSAPPDQSAARFVICGFANNNYCRTVLRGISLSLSTHIRIHHRHGRPRLPLYPRGLLPWRRILFRLPIVLPPPPAEAGPTNVARKPACPRPNRQLWTTRRALPVRLDRK
jgi:DHA1 family multidrug resistance protein-like MFS transporter